MGGGKTVAEYNKIRATRLRVRGGVFGAVCSFLKEYPVLSKFCRKYEVDEVDEHPILIRILVSHDTSIRSIQFMMSVGRQSK